MTELNCMIVEKRDSVALITLNRPDALNALNAEVFSELALTLDELEADDAIAAIVITGSDRAFAAGADISEMKDMSYSEMLEDAGLTRHSDRVAKCRKPVIAAVAGYALGGGCELAMMCDFIIAADNAKFGQPEIKLGVVPGIGGTQRLTSLIGKSKAMDLCLTGRMMEVDEAERAGLVARVEPLDSYLAVALQAAAEIAGYSQPVTRNMKYLVNTALETSLEQGLGIERQMFKANFALRDQKEGMAAFVDKRSPDFKDR
ncbi:MAG: enoyl-CoA hydratase [Gammaproteobacteria bacterium]|nr:enoyl-CoA hydratase [Gammaproteobacteria bacterium]